MSDHAAEISKHVRTYILVFVSLMILTVVTVAIAYIDMSTPIAIGIALLVASIKASLVACYFMHLISEKKLIFWVLIITIVFFIGLLLLPVLTDLDPIRVS